MDGRVQQFIYLMKNDLHKEKSFGEMAHALNLSYSRLRHLFKSEIGMSPTQYLKLLRLLKAKELLVVHHRAATTRSGSGGAAKAMRGGADKSRGELSGVEVGDSLREMRGDAEFEHLVEVAVIEPPRPVNAQEAAAHEPRDGLRVKRLDEFSHVTFLVARAPQVIEKSFDRHVGDRVETVERNLVPRLQLAFKIRFD